jgi:hypothetical protein
MISTAHLTEDKVDIQIEAQKLYLERLGVNWLEKGINNILFMSSQRAVQRGNI